MRNKEGPWNCDRRRIDPCWLYMNFISKRLHGSSCSPVITVIITTNVSSCRPFCPIKRRGGGVQKKKESISRPTRVLNWCNDGEREQFPFLPTSWWLCSEVPGGRQFIMCPSFLALSLEEQAGTCVHELPRTPPLHLPSLWRFDTERRQHGGSEYAGELKYIFTLSVKS